VRNSTSGTIRVYKNFSKSMDKNKKRYKNPQEPVAIIKRGP